MGTMINPKYEGDKVAYLDNDFIRKSNALQAYLKCKHMD